VVALMAAKKFSEIAEDFEVQITTLTTQLRSILKKNRGDTAGRSHPTALDSYVVQCSETDASSEIPLGIQPPRDQLYDRGCSFQISGTISQPTRPKEPIAASERYLVGCTS
jgi:hypothetical protein